MQELYQAVNSKMEFYPVLLKQAPLRFVHIEGDVETVLHYTDLEAKYRDPKYFLYCEYDLITFIPSLPPDDDPVHDVNVMEFSGVWHYDGLQRITAIKINERNEIKIEETVVPKDIQLGGVSILSNGVANILTNADLGTQVYQNSAGRYIAVRCAMDTEITSHNSSLYKPIPVGKVVSAVDSVLCSTNANEALTPAQKTAFWNRVEKEWVLKGTLNTDNKDSGVTVDLTGCTELIIWGGCTATGNNSLRANGKLLNYSVLTVARKGYLFKFEDSLLGFDCVLSKASETDKTTNMNYNINAYSICDGTKIKDLKTFTFSAPANIASCDLEIYAR